MASGRRGDEKKGVFCLETDRWFGQKDRSSVEPILSLLERLKDYKVPYLYKRVATRRELEYSLERYLKPGFKTHPVLYLDFHGYPGNKGQQSGLYLEDKDLDMDDLAEMMAGRCAHRVVYFGSCSTLDTHGTRLNSFLRKTGALAVCGYKEEIDWVESTAFDLIFLGKIQRETLRRRDSMRRFDESLRSTAPGLYRDLGFRMTIRPD